MSRPRGVSFVLLALGVGACANSGLPDNPVLKDYALKQDNFQLASGLRVMVQEDHTAPLVAITAVVNAGGTSDPPGVEGLAHFVEHLVFRSRFAEKVPVWEVLKRTGGWFNASTSSDVTSYYTVAHKDNLEQLMQLEAWRLSHTLEGVTPEEFTVEREVVRNELRLRGETSVGGRIFDELLAGLYPAGHPLSRPLAGTHASLSAATLEHAKAFVKKHYRPDNTTIVIAGDVNPAEVQKLLGKWPAEVLFGAGGPGGKPTPPAKRLVEITPPAVPSPVSPALKRLKGPVLEPTLLIAWSAPGGLRGNDAVLMFTASALNVALSGGIERKHKDDLRGISAGAVPLADGSLVLIEAVLKPGADPEKARKRILDAVVETWANDFNGLLVSYGKWGGATDLLRTSGDMVQSALGAAQHLATTGRTAFYKDTMEGLARAQGTQVADFAYKYLQRERAVSVFFEPESGLAAPQAVGGPKHDIGRGGDLGIGGMGPEEIRRILPSAGLAKLPRTKLPNGVDVITVQRPNMQVAQVYMQLPGGEKTATPYGLASVAELMSYTTCRDHGNLLPVGGTLQSWTDSHAITVEANVLSGNLVNGIAVLSDDVTCREGYEESFLFLDEILDRREERQKEVEKRPQWRAEQKFWSTLYPDHPYGTFAPDPKALRNVKFPDVSAYIRTHFRPSAATMVVVGDVQPAEVQTLAAKYLSRWAGAGGGSATPRDPGAGPSTRTVHVIDRPGATQTELRIGCRLTRWEPDTLALYGLTGEIFSEKAWDLRESWGATYGIYAAATVRPGGVADLTIGGAVEMSRTADALVKLLELVGTIGDQGPDIKTFTLKRWDTARTYNQAFATGSSIASIVLGATLYGVSLDVYDRYADVLANSSRASIAQIVKPCVGKEVVVMLGDAAALKPQLQTAGLQAAMQ